MSLTTYIIILVVLGIPTVIGFWKACDEFADNFHKRFPNGL